MQIHQSDREPVFRSLHLGNIPRENEPDYRVKRHLLRNLIREFSGAGFTVYAHRCWAGSERIAGIFARKG